MDFPRFWHTISRIHSINLKYLILSLFFILNFNDWCYSQNNTKTIAVLEFQNNSLIKSPELNGLTKGLPSMFINAFSGIKNLKIIDRSILNKILEKQALNQTGLFEKDSLQKVGKLIGANYLILGSLIKGISGDIRIDCRIVNSESGEIINAEEVTGEIDDIFEISEDICKKLLENLDVKFSDEEENILEKSFKGCSHESLISYSLALSDIDSGDYKKAKEILEAVLVDCPDFIAAKELLDKANLHLSK